MQNITKNIMPVETKNVSSINIQIELIDQNAYIKHSLSQYRKEY
jgi:hypothetical protein